MGHDIGWDCSAEASAVGEIKEETLDNITVCTVVYSRVHRVRHVRRVRRVRRVHRVHRVCRVHRAMHIVFVCIIGSRVSCAS